MYFLSRSFISFSLIIGAPRAQSTLETQRYINETGAIYRCTFRESSPCTPYVFERRGNIDGEYDKYSYTSEKRDFQWLGGSMDGGTKDTDKLIVCAPKFTVPAPSYDLLHGRCYWINDTLSDTLENVFQTSVMRYKEDQIRRGVDYSYYYYAWAEQGLDVHVSADNEEFVIGAPGIHDWRGSVIRYRKVDDKTGSSPSVYRHVSDMYSAVIPNPGNFMKNTESYFGYSVSSGYFDSRDQRKLIYVATAPQSNHQSGEVRYFLVGTSPLTHFLIMLSFIQGLYF